MADCLVELNIGFGADTPLIGENITIARVVAGDNGAMEILPVGQPIPLQWNGSAFTTVGLEQGVDYAFTHRGTAYMRAVPAQETAKWSDLEVVVPVPPGPSPLGDALIATALTTPGSASSDALVAASEAAALDASDAQVADRVANGPLTRDAITAQVTQGIEDPESEIATAVTAKIGQLLPDGRRDIREFLLPGETLDRTGATSMHVLFQRAIDALNAEYVAQAPVLGIKRGYRIVVPPGQYKFTTGLTWRSGVGIEGAGEGDTVLFPVGRTCLINGWAAPGAWDGVSYDDCTFIDFTIDDSQQTHTAYDFSVKGIFIQHMKRARFERVTIRGAWATGFGVDFLEDSWFINCTATGCGRGNPSSRNGTGAGFGIGVGYSDVESVTIVNCISKDNYTHGYFIEHLDRPEALYYSKGFKLLASHASGNWDGFLDAGGTGALAQGCTFTDNLYAAIKLGGTGTGLQAGVNGVISGCLMSGNGSLGAPGGGVAIVDSSAGGYTFSRNEIIDNAGPGIYAGPTAKVGSGLRVHDNQISRNAGPGIFLENPTTVRLSVVGNTLNRNAGDGMKFASALGRPIIRANSGTGNTGYGLNLAGSLYSTTPDIQGNNLVGNSDAGMVNTHTVDVSTSITGNLLDTGVTVGSNIATDPGFETTISGTTSSNAALSRANIGASAHSGSYVLRGTVAADDTAYYIASAAFTVTAGDNMRERLWVRAVAGREIYPSINWGTGGGQAVGAKTIATGAWQLLEVTATVPSGKTTARVAVNASTSGNIAAGEVIDMDDIELVVVTGGVANLLTDPSFETTTTGMTTLNTTLSRPNVGTLAHSGDYVARGTYSGAGGTGYGIISTTATVTAGQLVRGRCWVKAVAGRKVYPSLNTGPGGGQIIGPKYVATGDWQLMEVSGVIPASKTTCRIGAYVDTDPANATGEVIDMDDVEIVLA